MDELERLRAENAKLRELLGLAVEEIQDWCGNCLYRQSGSQYCNDESISQCSDWQWQHTAKLNEIDGKDVV